MEERECDFVRGAPRAKGSALGWEPACRMCSRVGPHETGRRVMRRASSVGPIEKGTCEGARSDVRNHDGPKKEAKKHKLTKRRKEAEA